MTPPPAQAAPPPAQGGGGGGASSGHTHDALDDNQLRHLCLHGNDDDSKAAEAELDRRMGDFRATGTGVPISAEGVQTLISAGMAP